MSSSGKPLLAYIAVFLSLAVAWSLIVPPYEALDELEHAEVIRHIATTGELPVHGEAEAAGYQVRQEASQPPLYHILAAAWIRLLGAPLDPNSPSPVPGSMVQCGSGGTPYGRAQWTHDPFDESGRWNGAALTLRAERLWSMLLQIGTLAGTWTLARRAFPKGSVPLLVLSLVAFNPQFLLVAAGANNDNAIVPLATWGLLLVVDLALKGPGTWRLLALGCVSGLAALSKLSGLGLLGLGGLVLLVRAVRSRAAFLLIVRQGLLLGLPAILIPLPWVLRNFRLYGDPTALEPMLAIVGRRAVAPDVNEALLILRSYWGQMPCAFYPSPLYWPIYAVLAVGAVGLVWGWRKLSMTRRILCAVCMLWVAVIVGALARWNSITPAPGGRLLFPAAAAIAFLTATGWSLFGVRAVRTAAALLPIWSLLMLVKGPMTLFSPPPLLPTTTELAHPTEFAFGDGLALRGYEARIEQADAASRSATLDVTLYWEALKQPAQNWAMAIQLVSPEPGSETMRLNYNGWPGRGNLPTSAWPRGHLIRDRYRLAIPASALATQAWALDVLFYNTADGERLPVAWGSTPAGTRARLTTLRVAGAAATGYMLPPLAPPIHYGENRELRLDRASVTQEAVGSWTVSLLWLCEATPSVDYTVFVHAYSAEGVLYTSDGPPAGGRFPPSLWEPADAIHDIHTLNLPEGVSPARIAVGLYNAETLQRAPGRSGESRLPDDAYVIWTATP